MWANENKILGIIGGMGPLATQLFYRQIIDKTEADCDQDHLDMILLNHASMPDRTACIKEGRTDELFNLLLKDAKKLEGDGAAAIAIPCNTSHIVADKLAGELSIPLINMIRETAKSVKRANPAIKKVGILATDGTIETEMYQNACRDEGIEAYVPSQKKQKLVMKIIYEGVKGGGEIDYNDFISVEGELAANGCESALMACTELSCFKEQFRLPRFYIDAMEVLAEQSILACGKKVKGR